MLPRKMNPATPAVNEFFDRTLMEYPSELYRRIIECRDRGDLLEAAALASEFEPGDSRADAWTEKLIEQIVQRVEMLRDWAENGKPSGYADPPTVYPKWSLALQAIRGMKGQARSILDVGCFTGFFLRKVREEHPAWTLAGCDIQKDLMQYLDGRHSDMEFRYCSAERLDRCWPDDTFHVITMFDVLDRCFDDVAVVERCKALLKLGGMLIFSVSGPESPSGPEQLRLYTRERLTELFPCCSFRSCTDEWGRPITFGCWIKH